MKLTNVLCLAGVLLSLVIASEALCQEEIVEEQLFPWPTFLAGITAVGSEWGADNNVCCSDGWATFNLTSQGVTKRSTLASCSNSNATWEGWQQSSLGSKTFDWSITSYNCGSLNGSFNYTLERGKRYLFYSVWTGSNVEIRVSVSNASRTAASPAEDELLQKELSLDETVATIPLASGDFTGGSSSFQCIQQ